MSEPRSAALSWSSASSAAARPTPAGSAPEPRPCVSPSPIAIFVGASEIARAWRSVLTATKSTCAIPASIMRWIALSPAPPTPTTRMAAMYAAPFGGGTRCSCGAGSSIVWSGAAARDAATSSDISVAGAATGTAAETGGSAASSGSGLLREVGDVLDGLIERGFCPGVDRRSLALGSALLRALRGLGLAEELGERALTHRRALSRHRAPPSRDRGRPARRGRTGRT